MGHNKALLQFDGRPMIEVVTERLRSVASEIIIVADDVERYRVIGDRCVPDVYPRVGTLGGIHAGLNAAAHQYALVVACDMPFLDPAVLRWFVEEPRPADLVVLKHDEGVEPLHALYRKTCLPAIESTILSGERCAFAFYGQIDVCYVSPSEISHLDPDLRSFRNLNTPSDWQWAMAQAKRRRPRLIGWRYHGACRQTNGSHQSGELVSDLHRLLNQNIEVIQPRAVVRMSHTYHVATVQSRPGRHGDSSLLQLHDDPAVEFV